MEKSFFGLPRLFLVSRVASSVISPEMDSVSVSDEVSIRIFEKILRTHEVTSVLVEGDENFPTGNFGNFL